MQNILDTLRSEFSAWAWGVRRWLAFLGNRRRDTRFKVFPHWFTLLEWSAVLGSVILFAVLTADRLFLEALAEGGAGSGFFAAITDAGKSGWILILTGFVLIVLSIVRSERFRGGARRAWHRAALVAWYLFFTVAASGITVNLLKLVFGRARPEHVPEGRVWFTSHFTDNYDFGSFPSGHSTTAGALAMALALLFPRLRVFLLLAGAWLAVSRPVVGVHFPSDAIAGFVLGAAFSYFSARHLATYRLLFHFNEHGAVRIRGERLASYRRFAWQLLQRDTWTRKPESTGSKTAISEDEKQGR